jgi:hypothetical protein
MEVGAVVAGTVVSSKASAKGRSRVGRDVVTATMHSAATERRGGCLREDGFGEADRVQPHAAHLVELGEAHDALSIEQPLGPKRELPRNSPQPRWRDMLSRRVVRLWSAAYKHKTLIVIFRRSPRRFRNRAGLGLASFVNSTCMPVIGLQARWEIGTPARSSECGIVCKSCWKTCRSFQ